MFDESLPRLTAAPIPVQTHILRLEERTAQGKALRNVAARTAQKAWKPSADRADLVDLLIESSKGAWKTAADTLWPDDGKPLYADQNGARLCCPGAAVRSGQIEAHTE